MIFRCFIDVSEKDLNSEHKDPTPLYKSLDDDLTDEINWIHAHKSMIVGGAVCKDIWKLYCRDFIDRMTLSKYKFYELIKNKLNVETGVVKTSQRCFVKSCYKS